MSTRGWLALAPLVGIAVFAALATPRLENTPPSIATPSEVILGQTAELLHVELSDAGAGLRSFDAVLVLGAARRALLAQNYPGNWLTGGATGSESTRLELRLDAAALSLPDGPATLALRARDWSWRDGFLGNLAEQEVALRVDTTAPDIALETGLTYIHRGGSGLAVYRVGEPTQRNGIRVGEAFFEAYPSPGGADPAARPPGERYAALFAIPTDAPANPRVRVVAVDAAGNEAASPYPVRILERDFPSRSIPVTRSFLEGTVAELARKHGIEAGDLFTTFSRVNEELRQRSESQIRELVAHSQPRRLWSGAFEQLRGTQVTSAFAERRSYLFEGQKISEATHFGFDLASTSRALVTAAAGGEVRYCGPLGIYGQLVLLDHGAGLSSLYGHLSRIDVEVGDRVAKGAPLGRTGATGLAAGDHLHFAILVGRTYVNPLEWWDPGWVQSHVEARLGAAEP